MRAGNLQSIAEAPRVIATKRGYFKAEGLNVETTNFAVTMDALPLMGTGQLDVMTGGLNPALFNAVARGVNVQVVAESGSQAVGNDWLGLNIRNDLIDSGRYKGPADLKGLKIGVPGAYTVIHYFLKVLLEKNGLSLKDVQVVFLGMPDTATALANKAVDGNAVIEPFLSAVERQGSGKVVLRSHEVAPDIVSGVFLMAPDFATKSPEAARRYMIAWERGVRDYVDAFTRNTGRDEVVKMLAEEKIVVNPSTQVPTYSAGGTFRLKGMQDLLNWYIAEDQIKGQVDLNKVVDFHLIENAVKTLGPTAASR